MDRSTKRLSQRIYYLAAALYFIAVLLRTSLIYRDSPELGRALGLLLAGLALFISEPPISRRWSGYFPIYLLVQTTLVFLLLALPGSSDFFAILLGILSMQAMLNLNPRLGAVWIGACAPIAWQEVNGERVAVNVQYVVEPGGMVRFAFPEGFDPALPLVIDPELTYSTYLGGTGTDEA